MTPPLASMILLSYRQEDFIEQAVRAALAQDYPALEILISDDCSPDRTYDRAAAVVDNYRGQHKVLLRRTEANRGIVGNFLETLALSSGEYVIGAAGDDISLPARTAQLVGCFEQTGADAVSSAWEDIDESGRMLSTQGGRRRRELDVSRYFPDQDIEHIWGATAAYRKSIFGAIARPSRRLMVEDLFYTLMLSYRSRKVAYVDLPLVQYRQHAGAATNRSGAISDIAELERWGEQASEAVLDVLRYFEEVIRTGRGFDPDFGTTAGVDIAALRADIRHWSLRAQWLDKSPWQRMAALLETRPPARARWILPRVFGIRSLAATRALRDRLRGGWSRR